MSSQLTSKIIILLTFLSNFCIAQWSHREDQPGLFGPSQWGKVATACDSTRQSPINIVSATARIPTRLSPIIRVRNHDRIPASIQYRNDGHGFTVTYRFSDGPVPSVSGGPLGNDRYELVNVHLHWPSEHTIDGRYAPAEVHIVHYNTKYPSFADAASKSDGLAVVGVLLNLETTTRSPRPFYNATTLIQEYTSAPYTETQRQNLYSLRDMFYPRNCLNSVRVWSYPGSLTVPTCNEAVTWLVSREYLTLSEAELNLLKQLKTKQGDFNEITHRPLQLINGRTVTVYG